MENTTKKAESRCKPRLKRKRSLCSSTLSKASLASLFRGVHGGEDRAGSVGEKLEILGDSTSLDGNSAPSSSSLDIFDSFVASLSRKTSIVGVGGNAIQDHQKYNTLPKLDRLFKFRSLNFALKEDQFEDLSESESTSLSTPTLKKDSSLDSSCDTLYTCDENQPGVVSNDSISLAVKEEEEFVCEDEDDEWVLILDWFFHPLDQGMNVVYIILI